MDLYSTPPPCGVGGGGGGGGAGSMYINIYVYMNISICICIWWNGYVHIWICKYTCIYFYICNYWCLWMCMYMDMYMYMIPFAEHWSVRCTARSNSWSLKFAFRHNFARSTHRILREGSSSRMKMCVSLQRRACKSMEMYVSLQWRVQNVWGMGGGGGGPYHGGGVATRDTEPYIYILRERYSLMTSHPWTPNIHIQ